MNMNYRSLLATVLTLTLAVPGAVLADRRGHGDRDYGHHGRYDHHDRHHGYKHYPRYSRDHYVTRYYHDDDADELLLGLIVGGVVGYAINNGQHSAPAYDAYPRAWRNSYSVTDEGIGSGDSCLQEREYTTTVRVGGKQVEAYGTACLQPDGSWMRGPAEPVSY